MEVIEENTLARAITDRHRDKFIDFIYNAFNETVLAAALNGKKGFDENFKNEIKAFLIDTESYYIDKIYTDLLDSIPLETYQKKN